MNMIKSTTPMSNITHGAMSNTANAVSSHTSEEITGSFFIDFKFINVYYELSFPDSCSRNDIKDFHKYVLENPDFINKNKKPLEDIIMPLDKPYRGKPISEIQKIFREDVFSFFESSIPQTSLKPNSATDIVVQPCIGTSVSNTTANTNIVSCVNTTGINNIVHQYSSIMYNQNSLIPVNYDLLEQIIRIECKKPNLVSNILTAESHSDSYARERLYSKIRELLTCNQLSFMPQFKNLKEERFDNLTLHQLEIEFTRLSRSFNEIKFTEVLKNTLSFGDAVFKNMLNKDYMVGNKIIRASPNFLDSLQRSLLNEGSVINTCLKQVFNDCNLKIDNWSPILTGVCQAVMNNLKITDKVSHEKSLIDKSKEHESNK